jgi:hypothetical protein
MRVKKEVILPRAGAGRLMRFNNNFFLCYEKLISLHGLKKYAKIATASETRSRDDQTVKIEPLRRRSAAAISLMGKKPRYEHKRG